MVFRKSGRSIEYFRNKLLNWFFSNGRDFPWRRKSLSNYKKVIAEILLQRTRAETASKFYSYFTRVYPSWKSLSDTGVNELSKSLIPIGLQNQRSTRLHNLAVEMVRRGGRFPKDYIELLSISHLGQYIANAVMLLVHGEKYPLLDVNMSRVLERYFGPRKLADIRYDYYLQDLSKKVVNCKDPIKMNWAILDFGALVCKASNPKCNCCPLNTKCLHFISSM